MTTILVPTRLRIRVADGAVLARCCEEQLAGARERVQNVLHATPPE